MRHPKCRPPDDAMGALNILLEGAKLPLKLFDDGKWRRDDGKPGVAFIGSRENGDNTNFAWVASCQCHKGPEPMKCPRIRALTHAREKLDIESVSVQERPRRGTRR